MKAVLLAAGKGTRMQGLCEELPKPILPIAGRPLLTHTLAQLEAAGVRETLLVVGHQHEQLREALGTRCGNVALQYVVQADPKGTGQAAALAEAFVGHEPFLLMFGDIVTSRRHVPDLVRIHADERPAAVLAVRYVPNAASGGAVYVERHRVVRIVERPAPGETTTHSINAGIFVFPPVLFDLLRQVKLSPRGEYELTDAIRMLLDQGEAVRAYDLGGFWVNVTDPAGYLEAHRELLAECDLPPPSVPAGVRTHGKVAVGRGCTLEACELGPDVSVGDGCVVYRGARVRDAVVMAGARLGAGSRVEHAVVGVNAVVGEGVAVVGVPDGAAATVGHGQSVSA